LTFSTELHPRSWQLRVAKSTSCVWLFKTVKTLYVLPNSSSTDQSYMSHGLWSMNDTDLSTSISQRRQVLRSSEEQWNVTLLKSKHTAVLASNGETTWSIGNNSCRNYSSIASERRMFFKPISSLHLSLEQNRYSIVSDNDRFTLSCPIFIETCARTVSCKSSLVDDTLIAST